jgi:hypothetical protein
VSRKIFPFSTKLSDSYVCINFPPQSLEMLRKSFTLPLLDI